MFDSCSALDGQTKVWDLRTYKEVHSYFSKMPPIDMDISDRGLLSLGFGCHAQVWGFLREVGNETLLFLECSSSVAPNVHLNTLPARLLELVLETPGSSTNVCAFLFTHILKVWKDAIAVKAKAPYMGHDLPSRLVHRTRFRPLQDVLGLGHSEG